MDALLGWESRRLRPPNFAIDIGFFHKSAGYRRQAATMITNETQQYLMDLKSFDGIRTVATFLSKKIDKAGMFHELQTTYHWDVYI